jgi:hypothetical protein
MRTVTVLASLAVAAGVGFAANTLLQRPMTSLATTPARAAEAADANYTAITADLISGLVTELGGTEVQIHDQGKEKIITFKNGDTPFNLGVALCETRPNGCIALIMAVGFDPGNTHYPVELFNSFNKENPFVSTFQIDGNKFAVTRMVLVDGGVTRKNLAVNIATFAAAPGELMTYLNSQLVAGYQSGGAFQRAGFSSGFARPVRLGPNDMAQIMRRQRLPTSDRLPTRR